MILDTIILWYGLLALTHLFIQINLAHAEYLRHHKDKVKRDFTPSVGIVIPMYNEKYRDIKKCVGSSLRQNYPEIKVVLVDDGSKDRKVFDRLKDKFKDNPRFIGIRLEKNVGKRHVQKLAFDILDNKVEVIVTIDSDTVLAERGVMYLVQKLRNPDIGAVTGNVRAIRNQGLLTRLIDGRYFAAFNQERCAQSLFGSVLCCSGPFSAYRSSIISKIKEKYINQEFLGLKCTYGDDRHLTNLVLNEGYKVKYENRAHAVTGVPTKLGKFFRQQVRWNKSFYRELLWTIRFYFNKPSNFSPYIIYDLFIQTILPFLLIVSLSYSVFRSVTLSPLYLVQYVIMVCGIAILRTSYSFFRSKDLNLLLFPIYSFLHIFLLIPARIYAIFTLRTARWGTR